jgi:hypothetical protein
MLVLPSNIEKLMERALERAFANALDRFLQAQADQVFTRILAAKQFEEKITKVLARFSFGD